MCVMYPLLWMAFLEGIFPSNSKAAPEYVLFSLPLAALSHSFEWTLNWFIDLVSYFLIAILQGAGNYVCAINGSR